MCQPRPCLSEKSEVRRFPTRARIDLAAGLLLTMLALALVPLLLRLVQASLLGCGQ